MPYLSALQRRAADGHRVQPSRERLRVAQCLGSQSKGRIVASGRSGRGSAPARGRHLRELLLQIEQSLDDLVERAGRDQFPQRFETIVHRLARCGLCSQLGRRSWREQAPKPLIRFARVSLRRLRLGSGRRRCGEAHLFGGRR